MSNFSVNLLPILTVQKGNKIFFLFALHRTSRTPPKTPSQAASMNIFAHSRYSDIQVLSTTEHAHLLRVFDNERTEQVMVRVFRTSREAEQSYILTEIASLAKLAAPQVASVLDMGLTVQNEPFMVFEQIPHIPLENVPSEQFHSPEFFTAVAVSALQALAPLHKQYRALTCCTPQSLRLEDITLPNVRMSLETWEPPYNAEVMRVFYGSHNSYAAPELTSGVVLDARADLYSLGVVLYEALTGQSFADLSMVDAPGMVAHLVVKNIRAHAPNLPDVLAQWLYGLLERERSMRFFSVKEALEYLITHGQVRNDALQMNNEALEETPIHLAPATAIGLESAFAAVVNVQSPYSESAVLEISGEPGVGKTFLLSTLLQSRLHSTALLRQRIEYIRPRDAANLADRICTALEHQEPTLFLVDDAEQIPERVRKAAKEALAREGTLLIGVRVVATHRSQLPLLATKPTTITLSHLAPSHLPLFCSEILGRCAFTPDFTKYLYTISKGHPLLLETVLRRLVKSGTIIRHNRIWTENTSDLNKPKNDTPQTLLQIVIEALRTLPEELSTTLAALVALSKAGVQSVSLHTLAELLDSSTQATMRLVLPLSFEGFVKLRASYLEFAHDIVLEAAMTACSEASIQALLLKWRIAKNNEEPAPQAQSIPAERAVQNPPKQTLELVPQETHAVSPVQISPQIPSEAPLQASSQVPLQAPSEVPSTQTRVQDSTPHPQTINSEPRSTMTITAAEAYSTETRDAIFPEETTIDAPSAVILHGSSKPAQLLRRTVEIAASHQHLSCLIEGTFGAQKEELAFLIHSASERRNAPFHAVSCADFSDEELEIYLFGNNGTPTGQAGSGQAGLLQESQGGTVFLDEIAAAPKQLQTRLGRLLQTLQKQRTRNYAGYVAKSLQGQEVLPDVRVIVGFTIQDGQRAEIALRQNLLQPELFFAVSSVRVTVPLLTERTEDIPLLAQEYTKAIAREYGISPELQHIAPELWHSLSSKEWFGDMSELEAMMRRLALMLDAGTESIYDVFMEFIAPPAPTNVYALPLQSAPQQTISQQTISQQTISQQTISQQTISQQSLRQSSPLRASNYADFQEDFPQTTSDGLLSIDDAQKEHILRALERTGGNKTKAAEMLRIKRTTLLARMKKFGLMP